MVMKEKPDYARHADETLNSLVRRLSAAGDDFGFQVSLDSGVLTIEFEGQETPIVVTDHPGAGQLWLTFGAKKYKLDWDVVENAFVLEATDQTVQELLEETISRLVGDDVSF